MKMKRKKGITLAEILIVIAIIGLLAAIAIPSMLKAKETSEANKARAEKTASPEQQQTFTITLEWKEGVKATPENIEIVYEVKEARVETIQGAQFLVLVDGDGERSIALNENLLSWKKGR